MVNSGGIHQDAKRQRIYLALFIVPERNSCFSIYQINWIKIKKVNFCKLKTSLSRNFIYKYKHFGDFVECIFLILLQIQHENNFLPTSKHWQGKVSRFLGICLYHCFTYRSNFMFQKCLEARRHLGSGCKTVNCQGYAELWEPIKTHKKCYSLTG